MKSFNSVVCSFEILRRETYNSLATTYSDKIKLKLFMWNNQYVFC